jgi:MFS family permease
MCGILLGLYLARLGLSPARMGMVVGAGLAGNALAMMFATVRGDALGRRRMLLGLALLSALGGIAASMASDALALGLAALFGMLNGMGRDRGASLVIEQAILPATTDDQGRTRVVAWYNVLQDVGHALGGLCAAVPEILRRQLAVGDVESIRFTFLGYAALMGLVAMFALRLSPNVEFQGEHARVEVSPETKRIVWRISSLFVLDSLGGGFLTTALLSFFFFERYGASEAVIGLLFFGARILNAVSHLAAAWLAKRIGLVNTMVFTHIPSSILLASVAFAPSFPIAALLFLLREGLVEMDVPTRQSYVMAVVRPTERLYASGVTSLVRMSAWAVAPTFAGLFMQSALAVPLFIGAGFKITYDILLWGAFRRLKPPEEGGPTAS